MTIKVNVNYRKAPYWSIFNSTLGSILIIGMLFSVGVQSAYADDVSLPTLFMSTPSLQTSSSSLDSWVSSKTLVDASSSEEALLHPAFQLPLAGDIYIAEQTSGDAYEAADSGSFTVTNTGPVYDENYLEVGTFNISQTHSNDNKVLYGFFELFNGRAFELKGDVLSELDQSQYPDCGHDHLEHHLHHKGEPAKTAAHSDHSTTSTTTIDVMIVYTASVKNMNGGTSAMEAFAASAIADANTAYESSDMSVRLNLVHTAEVSYSDSRGFSNALNDLTDTSDGYMDEVHDLRDTYGADMVSLFINNTEYCGLAWMLYPQYDYTNYAFSVVHYSCAVGYHSFAHELGHNQGCAHDPDNAGGGGAYDYSYGHRFYGNDSTQYRTVMAYAPGTRIGYFSNPDINYQGTATGTSTRDNARTIDTTASTIAAYRASSSGGGSGNGGGTTPSPTPTPTTTLGSISLEKTCSKKTCDLTATVYDSYGNEVDDVEVNFLCAKQKTTKKGKKKYKNYKNKYTGSSVGGLVILSLSKKKYKQKCYVEDPNGYYTQSSKTVVKAKKSNKK